MANITYVPSRIGEGHFTDFQAPASGSTDNGKIWAWNSATSKFEPITPSGGTPGGLNTQVQWNNGSGGFGGDSGFAYAGSGVATLTGRLVVPVIRPASDSTAAIKFQNAAGTTDALIIDTTNGIVYHKRGGTSKGVISEFSDGSGGSEKFVVKTKSSGGYVGYPILASPSDLFLEAGTIRIVKPGNENDGVLAIGQLTISTTKLDSSGGAKSYTLSSGETYQDASTRVTLKSFRTSAVGGHAIELNAPNITTSGDIVHVVSAGSATPKFAIGYDGRIKTNQAIANANTPGGATAMALPLYDATGTLIGYTPIYASQW